MRSNRWTDLSTPMCQIVGPSWSRFDHPCFPPDPLASNLIGQLARYRKRLHDHRDEIQRIFSKVIQWKHDLGIGGRLKDITRNGQVIIEPKPVLVVGDCSNSEVKQILNGEGKWKALREELPKVAAGLIACGSAGCNLALGRGRNRLTFLDQTK